YAEFAHPAGELLWARQHVGQRGVGVGDLVDVEENRARNMLDFIFGARIPALIGQEVGCIGHPEIGIVQMLGKPVRCNKTLRMGIACHYRFLSARFTRRFCLPLLSILTTSTEPISLVRLTCVPPQGCRSTPSISSRRTRPAPIGGLTDIVRTSSGRA